VQFPRDAPPFLVLDSEDAPAEPPKRLLATARPGDVPDAAAFSLPYRSDDPGIVHQFLIFHELGHVAQGRFRSGDRFTPPPYR